jgi:DNA-binding transcriptional LysR family regulator
MNDVDLRAFDLNLLVVFDVLMAERSVTRAAQLLGRTQSAVSHSLSRLREQFGDPLLIKAGQRMQPTPLALDLIEQTRPMLGGIKRVLTAQHVFQPATSTRIFRLAAPDFMWTLFADLLARIRVEAPSVAIEWTAPREATLLEVAEGLVDVAIVPSELHWPPGATGETVGALNWSCFGRRGHPAFRKWGRASWARWPHLVVRVGDSLANPVNAAASAAGLSRVIAGWVPNFSAAAPILARSDLLSTVPTAAMVETLERYPIERVKVPFSIAPLPHAMVWASGKARDPGLTWLRRLLRPIIKTSFALRAPVAP